MSDPKTALARTMDPKQLATFVASKTAPMGIPIEPEEWEQMPPGERGEAINLYYHELGTTMEGLAGVEFPRVKTPSGGILQFVMPDGSTQKTLEGVIIFHYPARAWWKKAEITGSPPDCSASGGKIPDSGEGPRGHKTCAECPYSQFGSATNKDGTPGKGQACKQVMNVFIKMDGQIPYWHQIPPTGLRSFSQYVVSIVNAKEPRSLSSLRTIMEFDKKQGEAAAYAVIRLTAGERLSYRELRQTVELRERFMDQMQRRGVMEESVKGDGSNDVRDEARGGSGGSGGSGDAFDGPPRGDDDIPF